MTNRPKRTGLGRGLSALLPGADEKERSPAEEAPNDAGAPTTAPAAVPEVATGPGIGLAEIAVADIHPNPRQPRTSFRQEELDELAASIREHGVLQPVLVRPRAQGGYELLGGERRLRASKLAGATLVPAIVREVDDRQALEQAVVENVQRADLDPLEEANAYRNLIDLFELTQEDTARRVGKSRVHVTNMLRLLELPEEIKAYMADGKLQAGHARALLAFRDAEKRIAVARRAVDKGLTVRQIEELARSQESERATSEREPKMRRHPDLEDSLSDHLSTDVKIEAGRGKGRIVITFGDREDLHRIVELLLGY